jgi:hypothetical protein
MIKTTQETVDDFSPARSNNIWHALARRALSCHGSFPMIRRALSVALGYSALLWASTAAAQFQYVQYRGMAPGWPNQTAGNYTAYYAPGYGQPMYYVARPVTGAYANPAYFGGYNVAPVTAQRPVIAAYYAPQPYAQQYAGVQYAQPTTAYYGAAPAQYGAQYAATNAYSVSPAGSSTAGAEAYSYYGQPTTVNYVPPRFTYRTTYAAVPVYMYRPVTAYQPVAGQPVTCLQPTTTTQCQPCRTRTSWFSHSWFNWCRPSCGSGACGSAPPTTAYCASGYCAPATTCNYPQCGQPYYPGQPSVVIPTVPAQPAIVPGTTAPGTIVTPLPPAGSTVPPPPTRIVPGTGGSFGPADIRPSLPPGGLVPRTTTPLGTPTTPPGSFSTDPAAPGSTIVPSPAAPFNPGGFGSGSGYAPATDPYSRSSTAVGPIRAPELRAQAAPNAIDQPRGPVLAPGVQTVPDPDALQPARPINRAPQLLDPRDKTASAKKALRTDQRWAVVPAVWPQAEPAAVAAPAASPYREYEERSYSPQRTEQRPVNPAEYDESGWTSSR